MTNTDQTRDEKTFSPPSCCLAAIPCPHFGVKQRRLPTTDFLFIVMSSRSTTSPHDDQRSRQQEADEHQALEEVDEILNRNRPRHLIDGIASGIGFVLAGAVGACGILVLSPHVAGESGAGEAGAAGRVVGGLVGAAVGVYSAASVAAAGVVSGVGQVVRGLVNTPSSLVEPRCVPKPTIGGLDALVVWCVRHSSCVLTDVPFRAGETIM